MGAYSAADPLKVGQERVVFVDKTSASVFRRRLTVNSGCRAPGSRLPESRQRLSADAVQLQDVESGEVLLFDIAAGEKGRLSRCGWSTAVMSAR